jgi:hypothetical protein
VGKLQLIIGASIVNPTPIVPSPESRSSPAAGGTGDHPLQYVFSPGLESGKRAGFILTHEPAVIDHIGCKDRCEAALNGGSPPFETNRCRNSVKLYGQPLAKVYEQDFRSGQPVSRLGRL